MTVRLRDSEDPLYERVLEKKACSGVMPTKGIKETVKLIEDLIDAEDIPVGGLRLEIELFDYNGRNIITDSVLTRNGDFWWHSVCVWWKRNDCDDENEVVDFLIDAWEKAHPKFDVEYEEGSLIISA